jgi:hypothetical protein
MSRSTAIFDLTIPEFKPEQLKPVEVEMTDEIQEWYENRLINLRE